MRRATFSEYRDLVHQNYPPSEIIGNGDDWFAFVQPGTRLVITCFDEAGYPLEIMDPPIWLFQ